MLIRGICLLLASLVAPPGDDPTRNNVVLIVADDLGFGDVGCFGADDVRTPHIDAIAADGVRFTQLRVNPLCAPTRAASIET